MLSDFAIDVATIWARANAANPEWSPAGFAGVVADVAKGVQRRIDAADSATSSAGLAAPSALQSASFGKPPVLLPRTPHCLLCPEALSEKDQAGVV